MKVYSTVLTRIWPWSKATEGVTSPTRVSGKPLVVCWLLVGFFVGTRRKKVTSNSAGKLHFSPSALENQTREKNHVHHPCRPAYRWSCSTSKKGGVTPSAPCPPRNNTKEAANALVAAHDKMEYHRNFHANSGDTGAFARGRTSEPLWTNTRPLPFAGPPNELSLLRE